MSFDQTAAVYAAAAFFPMVNASTTNTLAMLQCNFMDQNQYVQYFIQLSLGKNSLQSGQYNDANRHSRQCPESDSVGNDSCVAAQIVRVGEPWISNTIDGRCKRSSSAYAGFISGILESRTFAVEARREAQSTSDVRPSNEKRCSRQRIL